MKKYTKIKVLRISEEQHDTLVKMKSYNIDVGNFMRSAIKEKIEREYKDFKPKTEKPQDNFLIQLNKCILANK